MDQPEFEWKIRDTSVSTFRRPEDHLEMALFLLFPMETRCQDRSPQKRHPVYDLFKFLSPFLIQ